MFFTSCNDGKVFLYSFGSFVCDISPDVDCSDSDDFVSSDVLFSPIDVQALSHYTDNMFFKIYCMKGTDHDFE